MKKFAALLMAAVFAFAGCTSTDSTDDAATDTVQTEQSTKNSETGTNADSSTGLEATEPAANMETEEEEDKPKGLENPDIYGF